MRNIKHEGFFSCSHDWAGSAGLYDTHDAAVAAARRECRGPGDLAYAHPVYVGPVDVPFLAKTPLRYRGKDGEECRIPAGVEFQPLEVAEEDGGFTRQLMARLILDGSIEFVEASEPAKLFVIRDTLPCYVTYLYHVQAVDEADALEQYYNSQAGCQGHEIGDVVGFLDHGELEVEEVVAREQQAATIGGATHEVLEQASES
jgi:hypothetical protein